MRAIKTTSISVLAVGLLAGSAVGVAAQDEPPEAFTGDVFCGPQSAYGTTESQEVMVGDAAMRVVSTRGNTWQPAAFGMSDPRLQGSYTISYDSDSYYPPGAEESIEVGAGTWRIENDEGAWQGSYHIIEAPTVVLSLVGEGAYDGLTAVVATAFDDAGCSWEWSGLIVDGELPAYPEPPAE